MTSSTTPRTLPALPEEIWRLIIQHGVTMQATSDFRTWPCDHSNELNDQRLHDPTTRFDHQRERRDYAAMLPLAQTSKFFSRLVANELYQNIVLCDYHGIRRDQVTLLLRTLVEAPKSRERVKHITVVPFFHCEWQARPGVPEPPAGLRLMGKDALPGDYQGAVTFLQEKDVKKLDRQAQGIIDIAGLELAHVPENRMFKASIGWLERALAALVCLSSGLRSLSIQDPPPSSGWSAAHTQMDIDGFEHTIRKIRKLPSSYGKIFQQLEAVSIATTRFKNDSDEAFSVYSSPRLTGFQALGFLHMKDWHRLADYRSTLIRLDIGHLYPQLSNVRWAGFKETNEVRAREAREFRRILSTFTRLKFLRVSYVLLIGQLEEKTTKFSDMLSELLPPSVEDFQIAVFNHGVDNRYERPNIDMSVKCFFEGLESWTLDLDQYRYRLDFFAKYSDLWDISILVHQKGNSREQSRFWRDRRRINQTRLRTWLAFGDNHVDPTDDYHQYRVQHGYLPDVEERIEAQSNDEPGNSFEGFCPWDTLQRVQAQLELMWVNFEVYTFQPLMFQDIMCRDREYFTREGSVQWLPLVWWEGWR
ncbi:hypothetical protein GE21DRAFT_4986 [Neurospora crassa]|uniref:Uncharacterized protein n=1 Tax=Neurospora crassa (strain ATCC 24698 / 74-OR23-1A / CBS 708.71 / DSM 1257 / FGSC 987) TaxID=367110 RepID=Q7RUD2_NEUCR|nr:hypothetical protein NCU08204 [Neurospora crassa OR74A]EAA30058.2 hypothetical protein NCU08204 [Neurospora crassa OR74A]KHE86450.1 hypothetical protein GE21DRAFT_4986 [Neurospora crassa]|eukprot:XP_959294.2 hypothetical protein NCU08204 [Neurospora crassa OR74A]